ncbi:protein ASPARTIC PROTEASE IN GUARD CELL 1-like [Panicum miliaceum]|uniref:Protein ASPARTIC PROTEASE IN GUARD CELL 1-like n=1 Tax=Panicum miliaceum TaxID=4540 RepID=A0A3L6S0U3_PANMI|nr:protein ASPARTIC PROTEASE IN GUARD CELL 1-like [Panicum miliaceum]
MVSIPLSSDAWLPLNHRRGPCSPFPSSASKSIPLTADVLRRDRLRADGIRQGLNGTAGAKSGGATTVPTTLGSSLGTLEYVVTVSLGTPAVAQTVLMDTGSDVSWVQCRPCPAATCHPQKDRLFDPARSATYSAFRCGSAACKGLGRDDLYGNGCSRRGRCQYAVRYGDGSNTTGTYGADKLTLTPASAVDRFRFGCSRAARLFTDRADGLVGLGGGSPSLVSQAGAKAFSYCLPPTASYSGFLTLGVPRAASSRFAEQRQRRHVLPRAPAGHRRGRRRLRVPPSAFRAGAVMDSGTVVTRLPPQAYRALRAAFRKEMRMYPRRAVPPSALLDTCFNLTGDVKVPSVSLVFERGATVELDPSGIMLRGCLAFASAGDDGAPGIIGNVQQRTLEVLYDVGGGAVGFRRGAC